MNRKIALVIDDDPEIVKAVKETLVEELNYLVLDATEPQVAVRLAQSYRVDLLILDIRMQELDGFEVLKLVRRMQPEVKVMIITGYLDEFSSQLRAAHLEHVLKKPFTLEEVKEHVISVAGQVSEIAKPPIRFAPKARILIIDDLRIQSEILSGFILADSPNVYEIKTADTCEVGLVMNKTFQPDVLICDLEMPRMSGHEMLKIIRTGIDHKPKAFIIISAIESTDVMKRMEQAGYSYFTKPFCLEDVLECVRNKCLELELVAKV